MKQILLSTAPLLIILAIGCQEPRLSSTYTEEPHATGTEQGTAVEAPAPIKRHKREEIMDFNGNGIDDAIDISDGTSLDEDMNGIPDDAEIN